MLGSLLNQNLLDHESSYQELSNKENQLPRTPFLKDFNCALAMYDLTIYKDDCLCLSPTYSHALMTAKHVLLYNWHSD